MKVRVTLKDPDTMHDAVDDQAKADVKKLSDISTGERNSIAESRADAAKSLISERWMEYGEYLVVEFDTEAGTAVVIENGK